MSIGNRRPSFRRGRENALLDEVAHAAAVRHAASETTHPEHGLLKLVECVETRVVAFLRGRELELSNEEDFENPLCF